MALGFVEPALVRLTFNQLRQAAPPVLQPLYVYFEQQWLVNVPLQMWNVYDKDIRTNNNCEGWHNRFNRAINRHHPNIWHLIRVIIEEQATTDVIRCQMDAGQNIVREDRKVKAIKKRIATISERYRAGTIDISEYISGISHNLKVK